MAGVLVGSYLFGDISDRFGRKPTFLISIALQIIFGLLAGFVPEYYSFVSMRFVIGKRRIKIFHSNGIPLPFCLPAHEYQINDLRGVLIN